MKRLIPYFIYKQLEAMATIQVGSTEPLELQGYFLKAINHDNRTIERVWWNHRSGHVLVEQALVVDQQYKTVPDLSYTLHPGEFSIIVKLDTEKLEAYQEMLEWMLNIDMFSTDYIGNWAKGICFDEVLGWLILQEDERDPETDEVAMISTWRSDSPLEGGYFRLNHETAKRAIDYGILQHGLGFIEGDADGNMLDEALQVAILGEKVYC
jgi:hypothetical protein